MEVSKKWFIKGDEIGYISDYDDQSYGMFCPVAIICDEEQVKLKLYEMKELRAYLRTLANFGGTLQQAKELAARALEKSNG